MDKFSIVIPVKAITIATIALTELNFIKPDGWKFLSAWSAYDLRYPTGIWF